MSGFFGYRKNTMPQTAWMDRKEEDTGENYVR